MSSPRSAIFRGERIAVVRVFRRAPIVVGVGGCWAVFGVSVVEEVVAVS